MTSGCLDRKGSTRRHLGSAQYWDWPAGGNTGRLFLAFGGPVCADRISNCPLDRVLTYKNLIYLLSSPRQGRLFVFTKVRLITAAAAAAAGLWSPLNNFLAFHIFLSLLPFFKTIGAGNIFGILCADLKLYLR